MRVVAWLLLNVIEAWSYVRAVAQQLSEHFIYTLIEYCNVTIYEDAKLSFPIWNEQQNMYVVALLQAQKLLLPRRTR